MKRAFACVLLGAMLLLSAACDSAGTPSGSTSGDETPTVFILPTETSTPVGTTTPDTSTPTVAASTPTTAASPSPTTSGGAPTATATIAHPTATATVNPGHLVVTTESPTVTMLSDEHTYVSNTGGSAIDWRYELDGQAFGDCTITPSISSGTLAPGAMVTVGYSGTCTSASTPPEACPRIHWLSDATGQELQTSFCVLL